MAYHIYRTVDMLFDSHFTFKKDLQPSEDLPVPATSLLIAARVLQGMHMLVIVCCKTSHVLFARHC